MTDLVGNNIEVGDVVVIPYRWAVGDFAFGSVYWVGKRIIKIDYLPAEEELQDHERDEMLRILDGKPTTTRLYYGTFRGKDVIKLSQEQIECLWKKYEKED